MLHREHPSNFNPPQLAGRLPGLLATLLLTACASSGGLHTHATAMNPDSLEASKSLASTALSSAAWPDADWWTTYGDKQLDRLIAVALADQPGLQIAAARVRQAQAMSAIAGASLSPQIDASAQSTRQRFSEHSTIPPSLAGTWGTINQATLGAHYDLDLWGKNRATLQTAVGRAQATEVKLHAAQLMLTTALTRVYLRLDFAYAQLDLANQTLHEREQTLELTRQRVAAQIDSQLELTQARAALPEARERIAAAHESIAILDNQIAALQGKGPDIGLDVQRPHMTAQAAPVLPSNLPAQLIGRRPDVVAARWRVEAAGKEIDAARAQFYPNISLNAFVGVQSLGFDDFLSAGSRIAGIGPAISLPLFDGGRLRGNLAAHQAGYDIAVEQYNAIVISAVHDVVDQLVSLHWLDEQAHEQEQALTLTRQAYSLASDRYRNGVANYLQVLSAERQVLAQRGLVIVTAARRSELQLNLIRALGGGYVAHAPPQFVHPS
ncbi:MAG: efflux transporter outer membrane subunit [Dokdonella sp.]